MERFSCPLGSTSASTPIATTANGATQTFYADSELITLDTGGATTNSSADLLRAGSIIDSVVCRITTTITTATEWKVGDGSTADRFIDTQTVLTANTTRIGFNQWEVSPASATNSAAGPLVITTTGTPGAGAIRCTVFQRVYTAPTS